MISDTCDCCGEYIKSPYTFRHEGVWYSGHKHCMGGPMLRKLAQAAALKPFPNIAICGALRSGKDTVAAYLRDRYGYTEFAFGDEMKRVAHEIFDVPQTPKPRELYQWFGETMRQRDPDVWVRKCFEDIRWHTDNYARDEYIPQTPPPIVITDLRLPIELARCRAEGYVIIRIKSPEALRIHRAVESADTFNLRDLTHETESHVDSFEVDAEITNDGTLAELYAAIDAIMAELKR